MKMKIFLAPSRSSRSHSVRLSVCLSVRDKVLSSTESSSFSHRSVSGQSRVSLRSVSGQSQVSLRSVSGLYVPTSSDRRSLKYFVLFMTRCNLWNNTLCSLIVSLNHFGHFPPYPGVLEMQIH